MRKKILLAIAGLIGMVVVVVAILFATMLIDGNLSIKDMKPVTKVSEVPTYDSDYQLTNTGSVPTDEELIYYIATKIPDEYHACFVGATILRSYDAVEIAADNDQTAGWDTKPYDGSHIVTSGTALEIKIKFDLSAYDEIWNYNEDTKEAEITPQNATLSELLQSQIFPELKNNSEYMFSYVVVPDVMTTSLGSYVKESTYLKFQED